MEFPMKGWKLEPLRIRHPETGALLPGVGSPICHPCWGTGDPSLRLKSGCAQDDAEGRERELSRKWTTSSGSGRSV